MGQGMSDRMNRNETGGFREVVWLLHSVGRLGPAVCRKLAIVDVVDAPSLVRWLPLGTLASRTIKRFCCWPICKTSLLFAGRFGVGRGDCLGPPNEEILSFPYSIDDVEDVQVDVVFDPPWTPDMITEDGKRLLGID